MRISDWSSDVCSSDLDLADNLIVLAGTMALIATRRIVRQHRAAGGEVLHDDAENGRLHQVPLALVILGHRDDVSAEEDAHHAVDREVHIGQARARRRTTIGAAPGTAGPHSPAAEGIIGARTS